VMSRRQLFNTAIERTQSVIQIGVGARDPHCPPDKQHVVPAESIAR
jgi:hypothetical protein